MIIGPEREQAFTDVMIAMIPGTQTPYPETVARITQKVGWTNRAVRNNIYVLEELRWAERVPGVFPARFFLTEEGLQEAKARKERRDEKYSR